MYGVLYLFETVQISACISRSRSKEGGRAGGKSLSIILANRGPKPDNDSRGPTFGAND